MLGVDTALPLSRLSEATNIKLPTAAILIDLTPSNLTPLRETFLRFMFVYDWNKLVEVHNWSVWTGESLKGVGGSLNFRGGRSQRGAVSRRKHPFAGAPQIPFCVGVSGE